MDMETLLRWDIESIQSMLDKLQSSGLFVAKKEVSYIQASYSKLKDQVKIRHIEKRIIEEHNLLLECLTPDLYWVFHVKDKKELKTILASRKKLVSLYKRKLAMMERRIKSIELQLKVKDIYVPVATPT